MTMNTETFASDDGEARQTGWTQVRHWSPPEDVQWPDGLTPEEIAELDASHKKFKEGWKEFQGLNRLLDEIDAIPNPLKQPGVSKVPMGDRIIPPAEGVTISDSGVLNEAAAYSTLPVPAMPMETVAYGVPTQHRLVAAMEGVIEQRRIWNQRDILGHIKTVMGRLAQRHRSAITWLSRVLGIDMLKAVVVQASAERVSEPVSLGAPGIVPRVARTRLSLATGDVRDNPFYKVFLQDVRSEQAAPIVLEEGGREVLLAVVNQESPRFAQHHPASVELLRQEANAELTPLLHELRILEVGGTLPCVWNPRRYGWGLGDYLTTLLQQLKEELEHCGFLKPRMNNLHLTIWYVDQEDRVLSMVASTGFSDGVSSRESLAFSEAGVLGLLAVAEDWTTGIWRRGTKAKHVYQAVHDDMNTLGSRFIVSPELSDPQGSARFRLIIQVDAFAQESDTLLPDDAELQRFARLVYEQVAGYLMLYPQRAADEVRRAMHNCGSFPEQWHVVAETIETVLRGDAVTLYARPWREEKNLHVIAATAPLKRRDGKSLASLDPETRPVLSLVPSSHTVGDDKSYAGTLADQPGKTLRRNSWKDSHERIKADGFPEWPSPDYSESLVGTASSDRRFLGYSLPNNPAQGRKAIATVLVVRSMDRAPFKIWNAVALRAMLAAAAPMVQSWRDWAAVRIPEAYRIIDENYKYIEMLCGAVAHSNSLPPEEIHRLHKFKPDIRYAVLADRLAEGGGILHSGQDPIPRSESVLALTREIAADAYERARDEFEGSSFAVVHAAVLMEARGDGRSVMHPIAYHHQDRNAIPEAPHPEDPRRLQIPALGDDWRRLLDVGEAREFRVGPTAEGPVSAGVRIPFLAWIGRHAARGVLTLDLRVGGRMLSDGAREDFMLLARKLAAAWTVAGSSVRRGQFVSRTRPEQFAERLREHLGAETLELRLGDVAYPSGRMSSSEIEEDDWDLPTIPFERQDRPGEIGPDPDADLWGVWEASDERIIALRIRLVFGTVPVGYVVARWTGPARDQFLADPQTTRALCVRDTLAAWSLWSWSWTKCREDAWVFVEVQGRDGVWTAIPQFRQQISSPLAVQLDSQLARNQAHPTNEPLSTGSFTELQSACPV